MLETIKVKKDNSKGYHIINKSKYDLDPEKYEVYKENKEVENKEVKPKKADKKENKEVE